MKPLNQYIKEKLVINKDYRDNMIVIKSFDELRKIIKDRYDKLGEGTEQDPVDFNDIDVSNLDSFCSNNTGIFDETRFKYIDISYWDVSNIKLTNKMFYNCVALKYIGDISGWDVSNVINMSAMFDSCKELESVGDISNWDVSSVKDMSFMFYWCKSFKQDISNWNVSNVTDMTYMFLNCPIKDEYKPKFK